MTERRARPDSPPSARPRLRRHPRLAGVAVGLLVAASALVGGVLTGAAGSGGARAATAPAGSPFGIAEHMYAHPGGMFLSGWAIDPSAQTQPVRAYATVDSKLVGWSVANIARPDVASAHPTAGANHGFAFSIPVPEGPHTICVRALNVGAGVNVNLRCQTRTLDYGPVGAVQRVVATHGQIAVAGWTFDYDNRTAPLTVSLTVDGRSTASLVAADPNSAASSADPTAGANHGFLFRQPAAQGAHTVCVRATNLGFGSDNTLGCSTLTLNDSPRGAVDIAAQTKGRLRVAGWGVDPDAASTAATVLIRVDTTTHTVVANLSRTDVGAHGFDVNYTLPEGQHQVCVVVRNVQFGSNLAIPCRTVTLSFTPTAQLTSLTGTRTGVRMAGWATDPDTTAAISVRLTLDGKLVRTLLANVKGTSHVGHNFTADVPSRSGAHKVCAVALNAAYGTRNSAASCKTITLTLGPFGHYDSSKRATGGIQVVGWGFDPDTTAATVVAVSLDGRAAPSLRTGVLRTDVATAYPSAGNYRGFSSVVATDEGEHRICLTLRNVGGGSDVALGCQLVFAVHPVAPSAPRNVTALAGFGGATVSWTAPASDGGAPWSKYVVTSTPGGASVTVAATTTSTSIAGLKPSTAYMFTVRATNVAGASAAGTSPTVKTPASPPPQTTPAPVSTSRYIRNIRSASAGELAVMRSEGATDASYNPSGHGYLLLLDIGGQDNIDGGVVLSATTRFVAYGDLVKDIEAYVDGYASKQKLSAPATIAIGTNNDMEVSLAAGKAWADKVVDPVVAYTKAHHPGIVIAGANDIEPGFRATYTQTKAWLTGYLSATTAPFVFNGSADGCSWTATNGGCNNGWSMAGLYYLAAGAAPIRMLDLPQIYNYTMADQWKYISLTGVAQSKPRINFAGTLTEWTACAQTSSCGSITGRTAWSKMWSDLQSHPSLRVGSLPYSTDLRIDR